MLKIIIIYFLRDKEGRTTIKIVLEIGNIKIVNRLNILSTLNTETEMIIEHTKEEVNTHPLICIKILILHSIDTRSQAETNSYKTVKR